MICIPTFKVVTKTVWYWNRLVNKLDKIEDPNTSTAKDTHLINDKA